jgi:FMN reductase
MSETSLKVLVVVGSPGAQSATRTVLLHVAEALREGGCEVDVLDLPQEPLPLFNPETAYSAAAYPALKARVDRADVLLLGTPDYHGSMSSTIKNFLDHFWREFTGKLFVTIVSSYEKGLTVTDQLRTVARQCYAWSLPYGVSFSEREDLQDGKVPTEAFEKRLGMLIRDMRVYGEVLAKQRQADLAGAEAGFLARLRK